MQDADSDAPPDSGSCGCRDEEGCDDSHGHGDRNGDSDGESAVVRLSVPGMDCASCAGKVENSVTNSTLSRHRRRRHDGDAYRQVRRGNDERGRDFGPRRKSGLRGRKRGSRTTVSVPGMDCASCAGKVENALDSLSGVDTYHTQPTTGKVVVTTDPSTPVTDVTRPSRTRATRSPGRARMGATTTSPRTASGGAPAPSRRGSAAFSSRSVSSSSSSSRDKTRRSSARAVRSVGSVHIVSLTSRSCWPSPSADRTSSRTATTPFATETSTSTC